VTDPLMVRNLSGPVPRLSMVKIWAR